MRVKQKEKRKKKNKMHIGDIFNLSVVNLCQKRQNCICSFQSVHSQAFKKEKKEKFLLLFCFSDLSKPFEILTLPPPFFSFFFLLLFSFFLPCLSLYFVFLVYFIITNKFFIYRILRFNLLVFGI